MSLDSELHQHFCWIVKGFTWHMSHHSKIYFIVMHSFMKNVTANRPRPSDFKSFYSLSFFNMMIKKRHPIGCLCYPERYIYLSRAPERMHCVQTVIRVGLPLIVVRTCFKFGSHRLLDILCAWLILFPVIGPLPHISHLRAI